MDSELQGTTKLKEALAAARDPVIVDSSRKLEEAAQAWRLASTVGLDTEFVRERTYRAALGLVQISEGTTAWLVDPLEITDLDPLVRFLQDESVQKVIHSGSEDFEVMYHGLGAVPGNIVDSQIACAMLGQSLQLGYHHAAQWLLDVEVEKDHTRSNWLRRPLSSGQLRYAALDVVLLPMMMEKMREDLRNKDRWDWLVEEVDRTAQKSIEDVAPEDAWMRIGGAGGLNQAERTMLASLAEWREITALNRNTARGFVVSDSALLSMARKQPRSTTELERIEGVHPKSANRHGETWLNLIAESATKPPAPALPQLTGQQRVCLKAMRKRVSEVAKGLEVDAALLASRKQLELLIHSYSATGSIPERFTGWRKEVVTNSLVDVMKA